MTTFSLLKRSVSWLSWFLVAFSLYFVITRLGTEWQSIRQWHPGPQTLAILSGACGGYAFACLFLATAWHLILIGLGVHNVSWQVLYAIYAQSQIGKYLPGNIFHVVGRQVLGRRQGIPHSVLAASTLYEFIGLVAASVSLALPLAIDIGILQPRNLPVSLILLSVAVLAVSVFILERLIRKRWPQLLNRQVLFTFLMAYGNYVVFFLVAGSLMAVLGSTFSEQALKFETAIRLIGVFALSWLAGFLTPGAPSGIGVRETVIILCLPFLLAETPGAMIALLLRIVTVTGDALFFLLAGSLPLLIHKRIP